MSDRNGWAWMWTLSASRHDCQRYRRALYLDDRNDPVSLAGIGACPACLAVVEQARELARIPRPILVRGERGTGKELMAPFISWGLR